MKRRRKHSVQVAGSDSSLEDASSLTDSDEESEPKSRESSPVRSPTPDVMKAGSAAVARPAGGSNKAGILEGDGGKGTGAARNTRYIPTERMNDQERARRHAAYAAMTAQGDQLGREFRAGDPRFQQERECQATPDEYWDFDIPS